jgi:hypothetical protein
MEFTHHFLARTHHPGHYYMHPGHYYMGLLQIALLLLKNHRLFLQKGYAHPQAAILRGTFSSILSGEGFDEVERGELPLVLCVTL